MLLAALFSLLLGCATIGTQDVPQAAGTSPVLERLERQSFSAKELGIQMAGQPGSQTIRWKEVISPRTPVELPLLQAAPPSVQPRIALSLNGSAPIPVSVDSGAGLNLLNAGTALSHGVKVADPKEFGNVFEGLGGKEYSYYGMVDNASAGELTIRNLFTVLRVESSGAAEEVDDLLGLTTLAKFSYITIDFPRRRAVFAMDGSYEPGPALAAEVPFLMQSLQLVIEVQINERYAVNVLLDTGNDTSLMLTEELVEALELTNAAKAARKSRLLGIGGVLETRSFTVNSIGLGGKKFAAVEATVVPNSFPPCLGSGFLKQFRTTLDFKARKLWLER